MADACPIGGSQYTAKHTLVLQRMNGKHSNTLLRTARCRSRLLFGHDGVAEARTLLSKHWVDDEASLDGATPAQVVG